MMSQPGKQTISIQIFSTSQELKAIKNVIWSINRI